MNKEIESFFPELKLQVCSLYIEGAIPQGFEGFTSLRQEISKEGKGAAENQNLGIKTSRIPSSTSIVLGSESKESGDFANAVLSPSLLTGAAGFPGFFGDINSTKNINLFISGMGDLETSNLDLTLFNEQIVNSLNMYIRGLGITPGAFPIDSIMNLFLLRARPSEALELFISGYEAFLSETVNLWIQGVLGINSSVDLSIPGVVGTVNSNVDFYINGAP